MELILTGFSVKDFVWKEFKQFGLVYVTWDESWVEKKEFFENFWFFELLLVQSVTKWQKNEIHIYLNLNLSTPFIPIVWA